MSNIQPFKLHVEESVLLDLKERLSKARWPDQLNAPINDEWLYGTEMSYLKNLAEYWEKEFEQLKNWGYFFLVSSLLIGPSLKKK